MGNKNSRPSAKSGGASMKSASWNGATLASSDKTEVVEGNQYFPPESLKREYLEASTTTSTCPWKGQAHYYNLKVDGKVNKDAAFYYPQPKDAAKQIKDHVAFWKGVTVK
ncbi:hypothetical protein WJX73_010737 [Symbiochloris irregularis]|uniref:DUF427 domain-containing protein n=1 Tax=Symbiochloris irregularis TaxID=706552 RepID=A0AAW1NPU5_9CHLO